MKRLGKYLVDVSSYYLAAMGLSCGVNLQQSGYREHSTLLMFLGVFLIAASVKWIVGIRVIDWDKRELPAPPVPTQTTKNYKKE